MIGGAGVRRLWVFVFVFVWWGRGEEGGGEECGKVATAATSSSVVSQCVLLKPILSSQSGRPSLSLSTLSPALSLPTLIAWPSPSPAAAAAPASSSTGRRRSCSKCRVSGEIPTSFVAEGHRSP